MNRENEIDPFAYGLFLCVGSVFIFRVFLTFFGHYFCKIILYLLLISNQPVISIIGKRRFCSTNKRKQNMNISNHLTSRANWICFHYWKEQKWRSKPHQFEHFWRLSLLLMGKSRNSIGSWRKMVGDICFCFSVFNRTECGIFNDVNLEYITHE